MQPTRGCNSFDMDSEVVVVGGILSPMPEGIIPKPESLPFVTVGGAKPGIAAPVDEDVVGAGVPDIGVVVVVGDDKEDPDAGKHKNQCLGLSWLSWQHPKITARLCRIFF